MTGKNILIASSTLSSDEYVPVVEGLLERNHEVIVYNSDRVLRGEDLFSVELCESDAAAVYYNGVNISNELIDAMWYRKIADFQRPGDTDDKAKALLIQDEVAHFHEDIWTSLYDTHKWVNSPEGIHRASNKLGQLITANQLGFDTPETVIGSDWRKIHELLFEEQGHKEIIVKMVRGVIIISGVEMAMPTTVLPKEKVDMLSDTTTAFPGIYQPYKQKYREWRVTVVGDRIFPVSIYTSDEAKDDWRRFQGDSAVSFKTEPFCSDTASKCIDFLGRYGLSFGAFDFIEGDDGALTFLECNANGQYYRFEEEFGLRISEAIIDILIDKASRH